MLWAAFTALLSRAFDIRINESRGAHKHPEKLCAEHATLYADDSHLQWSFHTYEQFERSIGELRMVFAVF